MSRRLEALGYEVILFHASGVGGKSLERLASSDELAGVVDVTTHELADLVVDGVYSAGDSRLTGAGAAGLPQVIVPGAIDHSNFWVGQVPDTYKDTRILPVQRAEPAHAHQCRGVQEAGRGIRETPQCGQGSGACSHST